MTWPCIALTELPWTLRFSVLPRPFRLPEEFSSAYRLKAWGTCSWPGRNQTAQGKERTRGSARAQSSRGSPGPPRRVRRGIQPGPPSLGSEGRAGGSRVGSHRLHPQRCPGQGPGGALDHFEPWPLWGSHEPMGRSSEQRCKMLQMKPWLDKGTEELKHSCWTIKW